MSEVHIVWNPNRDGVITRLMVGLAEGTGWSIGKHPDFSADVNYWGLYISAAQGAAWQYQNRTTVAAWFTHKEPHRQNKLRWWEDAAKNIPIRLTSAQQYYEMLAPYGETHLVIPFVDDQFMPQRPPRVGVSGFVHPGGRKGEHLVKQLQDDFPHWEIVASGKGWPVPTKLYAWDEMPAYFASLDVYLSTATIEGIPMPPLEALACGTPVVVPRDVGLISELSSDAVYKYDTGNYHSMIEALEAALASRLSAPETMQNYSRYNWCASHRAALLGDNVNLRIEAPKRRARGAYTLMTSESLISADIARRACVVYVAYGTNARECATLAIESFAQYMPDVDIVLISDEPLDAGEDVHIYQPDTDIGARRAKLSIYDLVPDDYEYVLYLDADTEVVADISFLYAALDDGWEFVICTNPEKYYSLELHRRPDNHAETDATIDLYEDGDVMMPNGGVFAFRRCDAAEALMSRWLEEWDEKWAARDQMAFMRAHYRTRVKLLLLTYAWNTVTRYYGEKDSAGILHHPMKARRWSGRIGDRLDSQTAWDAVED